jgi:hypothetical protein
MKAFPTSNWTVTTAPLSTGYDEGMDLRDYFAAKCMPIAQKMIQHNHVQNLNNDFEWEYDEEELEIIASLAYSMANAMMKVRAENEFK